MRIKEEIPRSQSELKETTGQGPEARENVVDALSRRDIFMQGFISQELHGAVNRTYQRWFVCIVTREGEVKLCFCVLHQRNTNALNELHQRLRAQHF